MTATFAPGPVLATRRVAISEWTKLRSLRSTKWSLIALVAVSVGLTAIMTAWLASQWDGMSAADRSDFISDPSGYLAAAIRLGQLAVCVLGVIAIAGEYATGSIHSSVLAVPHRRRLVLTKAAVLAVVTFVVGEFIGFVSFAIGQSMLGGKLDVSLGDPGVLRAVVGVGLYLSLLSVFAFAIGALVRHTAGAITAVIGVVLVLSQLAYLVPGSAGMYIAAYLPANAGIRVAEAAPDGALLSAWEGFSVLALWTALLLGAATWLIERRDV